MVRANIRINEFGRIYLMTFADRLTFVDAVSMETLLFCQSLLLSMFGVVSSHNFTSNVTI